MTIRQAMRLDEYARMAEAERSHWWYRSLHELVYDHLKKHFDNKLITIIDAGCGTGGLMEYLKEKGYVNVKGFDFSDEAVRLSRSKGVAVFKGDIRDIKSYYDGNSADAVICNDILYFLNSEEQLSTTHAICTLLKTNGLLIANMPALKAFGGTHDLQVGIPERFSIKKIHRVFDASEYSKITATYWSLALSPVIWLYRYLQRLKLKKSKNIAVKSDIAYIPPLLNSLLFLIVRTENLLLKTKPFGSSLFIVMKKK